MDDCDEHPAERPNHPSRDGTRLAAGSGKGRAPAAAPAMKVRWKPAAIRDVVSHSAYPSARDPQAAISRNSSAEAASAAHQESVVISKFSQEMVRAAPQAA